MSSNQWSFQGREPKVGQKAQKFDGASNGEEEKKTSSQGGQKQASSTVTEVGKGKKRKADTETHAPKTKQVATDGTKRVSERQRKKK